MRWLWLLGTALWALPAFGLEFSQQVNTDEPGDQDPFQVTVTVADAPQDASLQFPASADLELLGKSESSQTSFQLLNGRASVKRIQTFELTMRATRTGTVKIPPSVLTTPDGKAFRTDALTVRVSKGHGGGSPRARPPSPFGAAAPPEIDVDEDDTGSQVEVPSRDSDLFIQATVDRPEAFVGEQMTLSLWLYSRVDLTQVDPVSMPKLDGFWSEDLESPSTLAPQSKLIHGIPYRAYLLKRRALFPVKAGTFEIEPAEADVTTGFFFAGRKIHRTANSLSVKVKPLPPGAPADFSPANVGRWKLTAEMTPQEVELGSPVTVRLTAEGLGNARYVALPKLTAPPALRIYDPTTSEKLTLLHGKVGGQRVQEYLVVAQQTGAFTLPALTLPYFDPSTQRYELSRTEPLSLTVKPSAGGSSQRGSSGGATLTTARNVLTGGGIRPLRDQASFRRARGPLMNSPFFFPALILPPGALLGLSLVGLLRRRFSHEDAGTLSRKKARAARVRLSTAQTLKASGTGQAFYGEVERALMGFMEAKLGIAFGGLTRELLESRLSALGVPEVTRTHVQRVLDVCDLGRFAPGSADDRRDAVLDLASRIMEGWDR